MHSRTAPSHFLALRPRSPQLHPASLDTIVVVAEYVSDQECQWRYVAEIVTPEQQLLEEGQPPRVFCAS